MENSYIHEHDIAQASPCQTPYAKGFARRADNFDAVLERGADFEPRRIPAYEIHQAIALALPELSSAQRDLLHFYASFLNPAATSLGETTVWPGNHLAAAALGISRATVQRHKAALERRGLLLRHYDRRNRPLEGGALDLSPFLARLNGLLARIEDLFDARRDYWASLQSNQLHLEGLELRPQGRKIEALNRLTLESYVDSVPQNTPPSTKSPMDPTPDPDIPPRHLLTNEQSEFEDIASSGSDIPPEIPTQETYEIIKASKTLSDGLDGDGKNLAPRELLARLTAIVANELPERNTAGHTWPWALKRHGWRAVELLAVALDDPQIKDRHRFLGYMATKWRGDMNLTPNMKRLAAQQAAVEKAGKARKTIAKLTMRDPLFAQLSNQGMKDAELLAWFSKARITRENGQVTMTQPSPFLASWLKSHYREAIEQAAGGAEIVIRSQKT